MQEELFREIINTIKYEIKTTQVRTINQVNNELINLYYRIGKILEENSKYGNNFITNISHSINLEFPNIKGFSERNLIRMKRFYNEYKNYEKVPQAVAQLPWGHNILLFEKIKDKNIRIIYAEASIKNGWSRNVLDFQIKSNYHLRIGNSSNNLDIALSSNDSELVNNTIKDPYIFDFLSLKNNFKEKELEVAMIERIKDVLIELGKGFSFDSKIHVVSSSSTNAFLLCLFNHRHCYCIVNNKIIPL